MACAFAFPFSVSNMCDTQATSNHIQSTVAVSGKVFQGAEKKEVGSQKLSFEGLSLILLSKWSSNLKNNRVLTFPTVKIKWRVLLPSRFLFQRCVTLRQLLITYKAWQGSVESFFGEFKRKRLIHKNSLFEGLSLILLSIVIKSQK